MTKRLQFIHSFQNSTIIVLQCFCISFNVLTFALMRKDIVRFLPLESSWCPFKSVGARSAWHNAELGLRSMEMFSVPW